MMSRHPAATRSDHQAFCLTEQWTQVRDARGRTGHHVVYELELPDARVLRTRISHPVGRDTYGKSRWGHILRDQLEVTADEFWMCVNKKILPGRGAPETPAETLPVGILSQLLSNGVAEAEIRELSKEEAIRRLTDIWSGHEGPDRDQSG